MDDDGEGARSASGSSDGDPSTYAQALRFLISLRSQRSQDVEAQRRFLQTKGLSDELIDRALQEAKRPEVLAKDGLVADPATMDADLSDADAFDHAARMFDDPLHVTDSSAAASTTTETSPSLPARTYPRSPLALYQAQQAYGAVGQVSSVDNPLTRYHVLLRFFRSLCYYLVLGGGFASIAVAIYRAYMLPKLTSTLDARSDMLKHHRGLYSRLADQVRRLRGESLAPSSAIEAASSPAVRSSSSRKSVLKKVQFADEIAGAGSEGDEVTSGAPTTTDEEDKKQAGDADREEDNAKAEKEGLLAKDVDGATRDGQDPSSTEESASEKQIATLPPIDIMVAVRDSLDRLKQALRADTTASAIDTTGGSSSKAASVEDESDAESWVSEDDDDSEELEFDPFAPPSVKAPSSKRKHAPKTQGGVAKSSLSSDRSSASASSLKSSLNTVNAYINTQTYMANANVFGTRSLGYGGLGSMGGGGGASGDQAKAGNKPGDVAQVRAEIRSLKGLLLSRRNFPIYNRPAAPRIESAT